VSPTSPNQSPVSLATRVLEGPAPCIDVAFESSLFEEGEGRRETSCPPGRVAGNTARASTVGEAGISRGSPVTFRDRGASRESEYVFSPPTCNTGSLPYISACLARTPARNVLSMFRANAAHDPAEHEGCRWRGSRLTRADEINSPAARTSCLKRSPVAVLHVSPSDVPVNRLEKAQACIHSRWRPVIFSGAEDRGRVGDVGR